MNKNGTLTPRDFEKSQGFIGSAIRRRLPGDHLNGTARANVNKGKEDNTKIGNRNLLQTVFERKVIAIIYLLESRSRHERYFLLVRSIYHGWDVYLPML